MRPVDPERLMFFMRSIPIPTPSPSSLDAQAGSSPGVQVVANAVPIVGGYQVRILKTVPELEEFRYVWTSWGTLPYSDIDFFVTTIEARQPVAEPYVILLLSEGLPKA